MTNNIPKIRFKGFNDEWKKHKYSELGNPLSGGSLGYDSLNQNGDKKCILYGDLYTKYDCIIMNIQNRTFEKGNTVVKNDILFPQSTTVDAYSLISPACLNDETAETSGVFVIRPNDNINGNFICYYTKGNEKQRLKLSKKGQGLTIVHLYYQSIKDETIMVPSKTEQDDISNLFLRLDSLITTNEQKLEKLKNIKSGLLDKMFPQKNEKKPKIRFKGFSDNWEKRILDDFGKATGGTSIETEFNKKGKYKVISIGSYSEDSTYNDQGIRVENTDKTNCRILNKDDLTMILNDKTALGRIIGRVLLIDKDDSYVYNQRTERIEININEYIPIFLYQFLNAPNIRKKIVEQSQGNTQIYVNWNTIKKTEYLVTKDKIEQEKIGIFFKNMNNLISLTEQKIQKLKNMKSALLEKMFV